MSVSALVALGKLAVIGLERGVARSFAVREEKRIFSNVNKLLNIPSASAIDVSLKVLFGSVDTCDLYYGPLPTCLLLSL